jgi:hypothetical protein
MYHKLTIKPINLYHLYEVIIIILRMLSEYMWKLRPSQFMVSPGKNSQYNLQQKTPEIESMLFTSVVMIVCACVLKVLSPKQTCSLSCDTGDQRTREFTDTLYCS